MDNEEPFEVLLNWQQEPQVDPEGILSTLETEECDTSVIPRSTSVFHEGSIFHTVDPVLTSQPKTFQSHQPPVVDTLNALRQWKPKPESPLDVLLKSPVSAKLFQGQISPLQHLDPFLSRSPQALSLTSSSFNIQRKKSVQLPPAVPMADDIMLEQQETQLYSPVSMTEAIELLKSIYNPPTEPSFNSTTGSCQVQLPQPTHVNRRRRRAHTDASSSKTPKPPNAFILYRRDKEVEVRETFKHSQIPGVGFTSGLIGDLWRNESPEVREIYYRRANELREEYRATADPLYGLRDRIRRAKPFSQYSSSTVWRENSLSASSPSTCSQRSSITSIQSTEVEIMKHQGLRSRATSTGSMQQNRSLPELRLLFLKMKTSELQSQ